MPFFVGARLVEATGCDVLKVGGAVRTDTGDPIRSGRAWFTEDFDGLWLCCLAGCRNSSGRGWPEFGLASFSNNTRLFCLSCGARSCSIIVILGSASPASFVRVGSGALPRFGSVPCAICSIKGLDVCFSSGATLSLATGRFQSMSTAWGGIMISGGRYPSFGGDLKGAGTASVSTTRR